MKSNLPGKLIRWFTLTVMAVAGRSAGATDIPLTPVSELARRADLVVRGTVVSLEARRDPGGHLRTEVGLEVAESWKGMATNRLTVVQGSAVLGERQVKVVGEPEFRLGEQLVLFAVFNPLGEAVTLDLARGKFAVKTNPVTQRVVATSDGARVQGGVALPGQAPVEVSELRRQVREATQ